MLQILMKESIKIHCHQYPARIYVKMDTLTALALWLSTISYSMEQMPSVFVPPNEDLDTFYTFVSPGTLGYKTLTIGNDRATLFVGARQKVFGLDTSDIRNHLFTPVSWDIGENQMRCTKIPQSEGGRKCYNQIQVIQQLNETHTIICGTNSLNPENRFLVRQNNQSDYTLRGPGSFQEPLCSCDPDNSVASLLVASGNDSIIVSTQRCDMKSQYPVLVKLSNSVTLLSEETMSGDVEEYVASFIGDENIDKETSLTIKKIYVVSVEIAGELSQDGPVPKTTVTQVCANDVGGKHILSNRWTSLLKLRLKCITADSYPLEFNVVTDIVRGSDDIIYGTFVTLHDTVRSSAVCSFRLADIQDAFKGNEFLHVYKHSKKRTDKFRPYRPGMCAYDGMDPVNSKKTTSRDFPTKFLQFVKYNFLATKEVSPAFPSSNASSRPLTRGALYVRVGERFTKVAVQQFTNLTGDVHDVLFVGTSKGRIQKVFSIEKDGKIETVQLASYQPTNDPIISMVLSPENGQLYIGTETALYQISTLNCAAYTKFCHFCDPCVMCVLSRDPGCGWDISKQKCVAIHEGNVDIRQDIYHEDAISQCPTTAEDLLTSSKHVSKGDTITLGHAISNPAITATWYRYDNADISTKRIISKMDRKYNIKMNGQLEISDFNSINDSAVYACNYAVSNKTLHIYSLNLTNIDSTSIGKTVPSSHIPHNTHSHTTRDFTSTVADGLASVAVAMIVDSKSVAIGVSVALIAGLVLGVLLYRVVLLLFGWRKFAMKKKRATPEETERRTRSIETEQDKISIPVDEDQYENAIDMMNENDDSIRADGEQLRRRNLIPSICSSSSSSTLASAGSSLLGCYSVSTTRSIAVSEPTYDELNYSGMN